MPDSDIQAFEFQREQDGTLPLEVVIFQALGAASVCWETPEGAGVFDSTRAKAIGDAVLSYLKDNMGPQLGLATTREILDEIKTRIEIDYFNGGGGLTYTTSLGRIPADRTKYHAEDSPDDIQNSTKEKPNE
jgi:hypothetical protein